MPFDNDILMSNARIDNEALGADQEGWVSSLHRWLGARLGEVDMEIEVRFEYDPQSNIVFTNDCGELVTREDVDEFMRQYAEYFKRLGKKAFVVSNIDRLVIRGPVTRYYAQRAQETVAEHILGFARWGTNDWARMTLRTTSSMVKIPANIFTTREEAVQAVEAMKRPANGGC